MKNLVDMVRTNISLLNEIIFKSVYTSHSAVHNVLTEKESLINAQLEYSVCFVTGDVHIVTNVLWFTILLENEKHLPCVL